MNHNVYDICTIKKRSVRVFFSVVLRFGVQNFLDFFFNFASSLESKVNSSILLYYNALRGICVCVCVSLSILSILLRNHIAHAFVTLTQVFSKSTIQVQCSKLFVQSGFKSTTQWRAHAQFNFFRLTRCTRNGYKFTHSHSVQWFWFVDSFVSVAISRN